MRRIGVLMSLAESDPAALARVAAFRTGLQTLGWAENRNLHIDIRWAGVRRGIDATIRVSIGSG
jgi:hypothetical protein